MTFMYRNRKTGDTITTSNRVKGRNWEPIEDNQQPSVDESPEDDTFEETPEEEITSEVPPERPKASRRGKK